MNNNLHSVGIDDIGVFIPSRQISLETLIAQRSIEQPELGRKLRNAVTLTGQKAMRFTHSWEDSATIAAQALKKLLSRNRNLLPASSRYLVVGTETSLDMSKSIASYIQGMLQRSGIELPSLISTFQIQNGCAGGALSLLSVCALLCACGRAQESGIIVTSDISRYKPMSTAEVTQGAGAVAVWASLSPTLIELDMRNVGSCSYDVDDFFRPIDQKTAVVKGRYSIECYAKAFSASFDDYCARSNQNPQTVLNETSFFALHTPFRNMAITGMVHLMVDKKIGDKHMVESILHTRYFYTGADAIARIGNIYNGALFLNLAFQLRAAYQEEGDAIIGKKILLCSYGSGNTMIVFGGVLMPCAPSIIASWDLDSIFANELPENFSGYNEWLRWTSNSTGMHSFSGVDVPPDHFYLQQIRQDGYREYSIT